MPSAGGGTTARALRANRGPGSAEEKSNQQRNTKRQHSTASLEGAQEASTEQARKRLRKDDSQQHANASGMRAEGRVTRQSSARAESVSTGRPRRTGAASGRTGRTGKSGKVVSAPSRRPESAAGRAGESRRRSGGKAKAHARPGRKGARLSTGIAEGNDDAADDESEAAAASSPEEDDSSDDDGTDGTADRAAEDTEATEDDLDDTDATAEEAEAADSAANISQTRQRQRRQGDVSKRHGVGRARGDKWWAAKLSGGNKQSYISYAFETEEAAVRAYDRGAIAVKGRKVAKLNFPLEEYSEEDDYLRTGDALDSFFLELRPTRRKRTIYRERRQKGTGSKWYGVSRATLGNRWRASKLTGGKKQEYISSAFETEEAAARAYDRGAIAVQGREVAQLNFPLEEYNAEDNYLRTGDALEQFLIDLRPPRTMGLNGRGQRNANNSLSGEAALASARDGKAGDAAGVAKTDDASGGISEKTRPGRHLHRGKKMGRYYGTIRRPTGKWAARLARGNNQIGSDKLISQAFETEEAAARAYDRGAIAVFGREVDYLNFPIEEYDAEDNHLRTGEDLDDFLVRLKPPKPRRKLPGRNYEKRRAKEKKTGSQQGTAAHMRKRRTNGPEPGLADDDSDWSTASEAKSQDSDSDAEPASPSGGGAKEANEYSEAVSASPYLGGAKPANSIADLMAANALAGKARAAYRDSDGDLARPSARRAGASGDGADGLAAGPSRRRAETAPAAGLESEAEQSSEWESESTDDDSDATSTDQSDGTTDAAHFSGRKNSEAATQRRYQGKPGGCVRFYKSSGRWGFELRLGGKKLYVVKTFATEEAAKRAFDRAAIATYGREQGVLKYPLEDYDAKENYLRSGDALQDFLEGLRPSKATYLTKSGWRGVRRNRHKSSKWEARVKPGGGMAPKLISSQYETRDAAARAYDRGTIAVYGREKAALNFPLEQYDMKENYKRTGKALDAFFKELRPQNGKTVGVWSIRRATGNYEWGAFLQLSPGHRYVISTTFESEEAAVRAHDRAAIAMYGRERAVLNRPLDEYDIQDNHMRTGEALEAFLEELQPSSRRKKKETKEKPEVAKADLPQIKRQEYYDACRKLIEPWRRLKAKHKGNPKPGPLPNFASFGLRKKLLEAEIYKAQEEAREVTAIAARAGFPEEAALADRNAAMEEQSPKADGAADESLAARPSRSPITDHSATESDDFAAEPTTLTAPMPAGPPAHLDEAIAHLGGLCVADLDDHAVRPIVSDAQRDDSAARPIIALPKHIAGDPPFRIVGADPEGEDRHRQERRYDFADDVVRLQRCERAGKPFHIDPTRPDDVINRKAKQCGECGSVHHSRHECPLDAYYLETWPERPQKLPPKKVREKDPLLFAKDVPQHLRDIVGDLREMTSGVSSQSASERDKPRWPTLLAIAAIVDQVAKQRAAAR